MFSWGARAHAAGNFGGAWIEARPSGDAGSRGWRERHAVASHGLNVSISGLNRPRSAPIAGNDEQGADQRQVLQGLDQRFAVIRRRLIPEIMEIEGLDRDENNQQDGEKAYPEIERDHQAGDDQEAADA